MAANFCMNCGSRLEPGARVCANCGEPVPQLHETVNPLQSAAIPAVLPTDESAPSAHRSATGPAKTAATNGQSTGVADDTDDSQAIPVEDSLSEERTQLIGMPPVSASEPEPSEADLERKAFHDAEIKSGTWNESSPASYRMNASDDKEEFGEEETRVISWTDNAPDGTCTVPFASKKPEAADLFEPPEIDLSGFDVPAQPRYDIDDGAVAAWGNADPSGTFVASSSSSQPADGWEEDRPAGYTGGLKQEATTQMPSNVDPMAGVKRSDTMVMDPVTAQSVYSAPTNGPTVYSVDNTARRGSGPKIAAIVIAAILVFAIIYLVQFNPYFIQNLQYDLGQWAQGQGAEWASGIYSALSDLISQIGVAIR